MSTTPEQRVRDLGCWRGDVMLQPLKGGLSNASYIVTDARGKYVARVGEDFPCHHVFRDRELRASRAAFDAGLSPEVVHAEPGLMVVRFIEARTFTEEDVRKNLERCVEIVRKCHRDMKRLVTGPASIFWVFHVLRDYGHTLTEGFHRRKNDVPQWLAAVDALEDAQVPLPVVFGHHDLLPGNFMDDGDRLWLIDWEYGGFGTAMFDLANIAANNSLSEAEERQLLDIYFDRSPGEAVLRAFDAMKTASALREAMWGMVSELHLNAPGVDYVAHADEYLGRYQRALKTFQDRYGAS
ncbi:MAG TPA: phosphotransferase [Nordella sp.]|nr:phosphotransferase [Nordella sp.]